MIILERIDDIVASLTPEEREMHRELIEECKEREGSILEIGQHLRTNIERLTELSMKILLDFDRFHKLTLELNETCKTVKGNIIKESIALIPEENFYHA